jgi:tRNA(Ile)-lysidine synthase
VAKRALALAAAQAGLRPLEARHLAALIEIIDRAEAGTNEIDLPGGKVVREYDALHFLANAGDRPESDAAAPPGFVARTGHTLRQWQPGDRMRPARLGGRSRKLSDLFADAKIPRRARASARVVVRDSDQEIVWAEYVGRAFGYGFESNGELSLTTPGRVATNKD